MRVTDSEGAAGALGPERLAALVAAFDERGLFVLENVVDPESDALVALGEKMKRDGRSIVEAGGWASRGDFGHGHLQLGAPRTAPWVLPQIVANPIIEQCVCAILRSPAKLGFYNGNCAMPGCGTQRLHMDGPHLYDSKEAAIAAGEQWPHLSNDVHVNINPAGAVTNHNGATEVWPGSHGVYTHKPTGFTSSTVGSAKQAASTGSLQDEAFVEARRQAEPPVRNEFPPGACAFRDARIWHRGVPNESSEPRPNMVLIYRRWEREAETEAAAQGCVESPQNGLLFSEDTRLAFGNPRPNIHCNIQFVEGPVNHFANGPAGGGPGGAAVGQPNPAFLGHKSEPQLPPECAPEERAAGEAKL